MMEIKRFVRIQYSIIKNEKLILRSHIVIAEHCKMKVLHINVLNVLIRSLIRFSFVITVLSAKHKNVFQKPNIL